MTPYQAVFAAAALVAVALIVSGVTMLAGYAWGLVAAGVLFGVLVVLVYDPKAGSR